jgi:sugar phosphate isomerase/epimerase
MGRTGTTQLEEREDSLMKIGVFTVLFSQRPFEEALDYIKAAGCEAVEIGVGGFPGPEHATSATRCSSLRSSACRR